MTKKEKFLLFKKMCQKKFEEKSRSVVEQKRVIEELKFFYNHSSLIDDAIDLLKLNKICGDINRPNSYIFYLLGITSVEPDYDKEFTFLFVVDEENKRMSPPDIDIDFEHREAILDHICDLYGSNKVALIGTAQTYKPKAAIQFSAKVLDVTKTAHKDDKRFSSENDQEAKRISKILPGLPGVSLSDFLGEKNKDGNYYKPSNIKVRDAMLSIQREFKRYPKVFELAKKLEGMFKNFSTHAAGVVISLSDITDDVPLHVQRVDQNDGTKFSKNNESVMSTQFDMDDIEDIGLLKFDFLQIDTLRQIRLCENLIKKTIKKNDLPFDLDRLDTSDKKVLKTIDDCKLEGLFQISGRAFTGIEFPIRNYATGEVLKDRNGNIRYKRRPGVIEIIGCSDFSDIVAANALGRPGPLICDMHKKYGMNKKHIEKMKFSHKLLEPILKKTYGQLIYQEQLIEMSQKLAGFTYKEADKLRKACAKKKLKFLDELKPKFFKGCKDNKIPENVIDEMWNIAVEFGAYAFNLAHSTAYAEITYQTAYLKTYYPEEFICAILTSMANKSDKDLQISIEKFKKEYKDLKILSPDINRSKSTYIPTGNKMEIISPFISLPGVGEKVSDHIVELQEFATIYHFLESVDTFIVNSKTINLFKENGVFDSIGEKKEISIGIRAYKQMSGLVGKKKKRLSMSPLDLKKEIRIKNLF